jgi:hypothetical protein
VKEYLGVDAFQETVWNSNGEPLDVLIDEDSDTFRFMWDGSLSVFQVWGM